MYCEGKTISPEGRSLKFWVDENCQITPQSQNWVQRWRCCSGPIPLLPEDQGFGDDWNVPEFVEASLEISEPTPNSDQALVQPSYAMMVTETDFEALQPEQVNDEEDLAFVRNRCTIYTRNLRIQPLGIERCTTGNEYRSTTTDGGGFLRITVTTRGRNPSKALVSAELGSDKMRAIAWHESRWRQFSTDGTPLVNRNTNGTADWGMMQINQADYPLHWCWKSNVARGKAIFEEKLRHAKVYLDRHGNYTPQMLEDEALQRYNGGRYHAWSSTDSRWIPSPPNQYVDFIKRYISKQPWK